MPPLIPPKTLNAKHKQLILMAALGHKQSEIAEATGMTQAWISTILASPKAQLLLHKIQVEIEGEALATHTERIQSLVPKALDRVEDLIDNGTSEDGVRLSAAKDILDRTIPKRSITEIDETFRVVIDGADITALARVVAEDEGRVLEISQPFDEAGKRILAKMPEDLED